MYVRKCERKSGGEGSSPVRIAEDRRRETFEVEAQDVDGSGIFLSYNLSEEKYIQVCYSCFLKADDPIRQNK